MRGQIWPTRKSTENSLIENKSYVDYVPAGFGGVSVV